MAAQPAVRYWSMPSRDELRRTSRWVWVLVALAVLLALVLVADTAEVTANALIAAVTSAAPLIAAAALLYVAPRQGLVALSAFGFAVPPIITLVETFFGRDYHDLLRLPLDDYMNLAATARNITGLAGNLDWLFGLVAVLALAFYIGRVQSRIGWLIVGVGLIVGVFELVTAVMSWLPFIEEGDGLVEPGSEVLGYAMPSALGHVVLSTLAVLSGVGWAYLAAVAVDRRLLLIALAPLLSLATSLIGLAMWAVLAVVGPNPFVDISDPAGAWVLPIFWLIGTSFWPIFVAGILLQLPRNGRVAQATPVETAEAQALGR